MTSTPLHLFGPPRTDRVTQMVWSLPRYEAAGRLPRDAELWWMNWNLLFSDVPLPSYYLEFRPGEGEDEQRFDLGVTPPVRWVGNLLYQHGRELLSR